MTEPTATMCFSPNYAVARAKFLLAAAEADAVVSSYINTVVSAPNGGTLSTDVAVFGPKNAEHALIIISGTHGPECFIGSAAQIALMHEIASGALTTNTRIILIHAINPWGFANLSRTTENSVDLNRNFIDWSQPVPANHHYEELHHLLLMQRDSQEQSHQAQQAIENWISTHGKNAYINASMCGQYLHADGVNYGGQHPEWSHHVLQKIIAEHLGEAQKLALIDWHTGIGEHAEPFFLCFNERASEAWDRACHWWGKNNIENLGGFDGAERPKYTGLLFDGIRRFASPAEVTGAVIEFGTLPLKEVYAALHADRKLQGGKVTDPQERRALTHQILEAFCPSSSEWKTQTLKHALHIQRQALNGLKQWR